MCRFEQIKPFAIVRNFITKKLPSIIKEISADELFECRTILLIASLKIKKT